MLKEIDLKNWIEKKEKKKRGGANQLFIKLCNVDCRKGGRTEQKSINSSGFLEFFSADYLLWRKQMAYLTDDRKLCKQYPVLCYSNSLSILFAFLPRQQRKIREREENKWLSGKAHDFSSNSHFLKFSGLLN